MLSLIVFLILGIIIGIITGLIPGLHPNSVSLITISLALSFPPLPLAVFLIAMGVTNSFLTFIPSILLGAPEENVLVVLPGHQLLMQGRGYEAIYLSVVGGLGACIISLVTLPLFSLIIPIIYPLLRPNTHWLLIFVASYMIFSEKKSFFALITFLLAGLLGIFSLNHIDSAALFPLLTGLFALPILRSSYKQKVVLPDKISFQVEHLSKKFLLYSASIGSLAGILAGLLPGIGSSQAAVLAQEAINTKENKKSTRSFLMSLGGINTADIIYSLFAILLIGKARSGVAIAVNEIIQLTFNDIFLLCGVILISSIVSAAITLKISRIAILNIRKINYIKLSRSVFYFLWLLILLFSGISGILIALPAMLIGFLPQKLGIRRTHLMGCLMIPTILYFL